MGTRGSLTGGHRGLRWKHFDPAAVPERRVSREPTPDRSYNAERLPWTEEAWEVAEPDPRASNKKLYRGLYATLREGAPLAVTAESVRRQIAVLERCRELSPV